MWNLVGTLMLTVGSSDADARGGGRGGSMATSSVSSANCGNVNTGNVNRGNVNTGNVNRGNVNTSNVNRGNVNTGNVKRGNVNTGNINNIQGGDRNIQHPHLTTAAVVGAYY